MLVLVKRYSPNSADAPSDEIREWLELGGSLADAQRALRKVRENGGLGVVVPMRYRTAEVTEEEAKAIAQTAFDGLRGDFAGTFSELSDGGDEGAFWHFTVEDFEAQARGVIPGTRSFIVDKVDGRLWSQDEVTEFWRLSARS